MLCVAFKNSTENLSGMETGRLEGTGDFVVGERLIKLRVAIKANGGDFYAIEE